MDTIFLQKTGLFTGMTDDEIRTALDVLSAEEKSYAKSDILFLAGETTDRMGLVLSGSVHVESNDMWGNRTLLNHVGVGQLFAETYALLEGEPMLVDVTANEDCRVLYIRTRGLKKRLQSSSPWAEKFTYNLLRISMQKNLHLAERSFHTAPKSVRGRVMAYLNTVALQQNAREFDIPFDRQQLADYLNLDRSALSKELTKMRQEKILLCRKNHFVLLEEDAY